MIEWGVDLLCEEEKLWFIISNDLKAAGMLELISKKLIINLYLNAKW